MPTCLAIFRSRRLPMNRSFTAEHLFEDALQGVFLFAQNSFHIRQIALKFRVGDGISAIVGFGCFGWKNPYGMATFLNHFLLQNFSHITGVDDETKEKR